MSRLPVALDYPDSTFSQDSSDSLPARRLALPLRMPSKTFGSSADPSARGVRISDRLKEALALEPQAERGH